ncbi:SEC-C domain-containing protein [Candidatus Woesearchaeota archaeon]|nr:SEC-C domain-containing protein [Candidatus Woesearchaeota archaeon]
MGKAKNMTMYEKLMALCPCGSKKKYVQCCGKSEPCPCGSGKTALQCCFKSPATHPKVGKAKRK